MRSSLPFTISSISPALLVLSLLGGAPLPAQEREPAAHELVWTDARTLRVEGRGWNDTAEFYDRLPARAAERVPPAVWNLSRNSAGMLVRFITDATNVVARWAVTSPNLGMPHMAANAVSGLDLYVRTSPTAWHWLAVGAARAQTNTATLVKDCLPGRREYLIYLPLYNGTRFLELGIEPGATLSPAGAWGPGERKPILFYGTSILHGACASRAGMNHAAILGRRFNRPTINLGFSGNGRMEIELADLMAELDPAVYVLDCLPNMNAEQVAGRVEPFVRRLRQAHPKTPIVLVEDRTYQYAFLKPAAAQRNETSRAALKSAFQNLRRAGVKGLYYIEGAQLLGDDGEATADGSHPTDLGFMRQAEVMAKTLGPLLKSRH